MSVLRGKLMRAAVLLIVSCVLFYFFPLFHVRRLGSEEEPGNSEQGSGRVANEAADPAAYVETFWNAPLRRGDGVVDVVDFRQAFDADPAKAKQDFGREVGLGGASYFCIRGQGTVESIEKNQCTISVTGDNRLVQLELGVLVDNTVREAIGVNVSEFANSQDFNSVSSALNARIEDEVIKPNKDLLEPGVAVEFVGCAKVRGKSDLDPLQLVPIKIKADEVGP